MVLRLEHTHRQIKSCPIILMERQRKWCQTRAFHYQHQCYLLVVEMGLQRKQNRQLVQQQVLRRPRWPRQRGNPRYPISSTQWIEPTMVSRLRLRDEGREDQGLLQGFRYEDWQAILPHLPTPIQQSSHHGWWKKPCYLE